MTNPLSLLIKIAKEKIHDSKWDNQPLQIIKIMPNSTKGDLVEEFVSQYSQTLGLKVGKRINRLGDYDLMINEKKFEVKMATEDISGNFQFNHIRYDYQYDFLLCIGIAPNTIFFDIYSKADVATGKAGQLVTMGRGQNSSFKLTKSKKSLHPIVGFKEKIRSLT